MSRSYYEYLKARDAWRVQHNLRVSSFPNPPEDSIVYTRESTEDFWERRRKRTQDLIPQQTLNFSVEDTFKFINDVARQERDKEEEFLEQFFPKGEYKEGDTLTDKFNILFQSRERYERLLKRIETARLKASNGWKGMAPNMDALYATYLNTRLTRVLQEFRDKFDVNTDFKVLERIFNELVDKAIIDATNDIASIVTKNSVYGSGEDWTEIAETLNSDQYLKEQFIGNMRAAIGNKNFDNVLSTIYNQKKIEHGAEEKTSSILRKNLKLSKRTAAIGGNVIENTSAALAKALSKVRGANKSASGTIEYDMSGAAVSGQMVTTDTILVFSGDASVSAQGVVEKLNKVLSENSGSLDNAHEKIQEFYQQEKDKMDKLYTVFINSKNYQLGGNYGTYSQHKDGNLNELDSFLEEAGVKVGSINEFLLAAYNTAKDAFLYGQKDAIYEGAIDALKAAAVKFMFDDWQTIGENQSNNIHMFLLSGKYVPSSEIFKAMADAGNAAVSARANIIIPGIKDPGPKGWEGSTDLEIKNNILKYWNEEFQRISSDSRWTADFVINVKRAIG